MEHLPLMLFSLCLQAAIGTMVFMMIVKLTQKEQEFKIAALTTAILSVVGVLASLIHLGTPTHALNSLLNLGSSWLSREVLFAGAFMGLAILYVILLYVKPAAKSVLHGIGWLASFVGLAEVFMMAKVYTSSSVVSWQGAVTYIEFFASMIVFGAAILFLTSAKSLDSKTKTYFAISVAVAVGAQVAFTLPHYINLGLMDGAGTASAALLSEMSGLVITQWLFLVLGAGFLLFSKIQEGKINFTGYYLTGTVLCLGLVIGRYLFYAISVASRVGLS